MGGQKVVSHLVNYLGRSELSKQKGSSVMRWPGSLSGCVAVTCSPEMDVFDMDVSKAS